MVTAMNNSHTQLRNAPLLVEFTRGVDKSGDPITERLHYGIVAVVNGLGDIVHAVGDIDYFSHMRSCAKPFQLLPLFEAGFFDDDAAKSKLGLKPFDPVLMMSSHAGQAIHTTRVNELLSRLGLDISALRCGVHPPYDANVLCELLARHEKPSELHNNCSGKHLGMLLACLSRGYDRHSYESPNHPLQARIKELAALISDVPADDIAFGIDGCSLPTLVLPLKNLALMFARMSYWAHVPTASTGPAFLPQAFRTMWDAATTYPEYLAGEKRFDTALIRASNQGLFSKNGADGLLALAKAPDARYPHGLGIVIKIEDGDIKQQIRPIIAKAVLEHLGLWPNEKSLLDYVPPTTNFRGLSIGDIRCHLKLSA